MTKHSQPSSTTTIKEYTGDTSQLSHNLDEKQRIDARKQSPTHNQSIPRARVQEDPKVRTQVLSAWKLMGEKGESCGEKYERSTAYICLQVCTDHV